MFTSVAVIALLFPGAGDEKKGPPPPPEGVFALQGVVVRVHKDALEVEIEDAPSAFRFEPRQRLRITKETRLEQMQIGKVGLAKVIALSNLKPQQTISVIVHSHDKGIDLMRGIASPTNDVTELAQQISKLGGKFKRIRPDKNRFTYELDLRGTRVTDDDLKLFGEARGLTDLDLSFTVVTDKGIAHLARAAELDTLRLNGTKVTDAAVLLLRRLPQLRAVELAQTAITDAGIEELVRLKTLSVVRAGLGNKAHFRVHQRFEEGVLYYNFLMIGDTHFGTYLAGSSRGGILNEEPGLRRRQATTYYHRKGPVGQVMAKLEWFRPAGLLDYPSDVRLPASLVGMLAVTPSTHALGTLWAEPAIGIVRLNVGTHAAYGRPMQHIHFYDSTPEIKTFSLSMKGRPPYFGYVQDALKRGCAVRIIDGPERPTFSKIRPKSFYSALFVEAARNDLRDIDTSLFTKEAVAEMMESLTETGVLCYHTSHRYFALFPSLVDAAKANGLAWKLMKDQGGYERGDSMHFGSEWLMIARNADYLDHLHEVNEKGHHLDCEVPESTGNHLWRDGQPHNLKALLRTPNR